MTPFPKSDHIIYVHDFGNLHGMYLIISYALQYTVLAIPLQANLCIHICMHYNTVFALVYSTYVGYTSMHSLLL